MDSCEYKPETSVIARCTRVANAAARPVCRDIPATRPAPLTHPRYPRFPHSAMPRCEGSAGPAARRGAGTPAAHTVQCRKDAHHVDPVRTERYAKVIEVSKRVRWEIERDVIRGRRFDYAQDVPARGPVAGRRARVPERRRQARLLSQVQGRTYAYMFGLVERFIGAKMLEISREHCARRPGRAGGAGALHRRGAEAPGAVPPPRSHDGRRHAGRLRDDAPSPTPWRGRCSARAPGPCSR